MVHDNGSESHDTWESSSFSEEYSDEGFEIVEFQPDKDETLSENDCLQINCIDLASCYDGKWRLLGCHIDQTDSVAIKLDQLLQEGKISKDQILYKYLLYEDPHTYITDVAAFFLTIMYLGGKSTFNFFCGPKCYCQGIMLPGKRDFSKVFMNIRCPSKSLSQN